MPRFQCYEDCAVKCPFFLKQTDTVISCEGVERTHSIGVTFTKRTRKQEYISCFCGKDFESCPIYKEVYKKYENPKVPQYQG